MFLIYPGRGMKGVGVKMRENEVEEVEGQRSRGPKQFRCEIVPHPPSALENNLAVNY